MMRSGLIVALVPAVVALSAFNLNGNFLGTDMRPDLVAHTLAKVEDGWMKQATEFAHCMAESTDCQESSEAFSKSCTQVVKGIVQGSAGDRERTVEYMDDVCGQKSLMGWHKATCLSLRKTLNEKMTDSSFDNRESMNLAKVCDVTWSVLANEQKQEVQNEIEMKKEAEAKAAEETAKEAKEEQEAKELAEKKASEEAMKKAREAEEQAEAKEKEMKEEEEERKKKEVKEETVEEESFEKTKKEVEAVERAADEKIEEADDAEHDDTAAPKVAPAAKEASKPVPAAKEASKPVVKEAVQAAPKPAAPKPAAPAAPVVSKEAKPAVAPKEAKPAVVKVAAVAKPAPAKETKAPAQVAKPAAPKVEKPAVKAPKA